MIIKSSDCELQQRHVHAWVLPYMYKGHYLFTPPSTLPTLTKAFGMSPTKLWCVYHNRWMFRRSTFHRSLTLIPGKKEKISLTDYLQLTNVSLGKDIHNPYGRNTIEISYSQDHDVGNTHTAVICSLICGKVCNSAFLFHVKNLRINRLSTQPSTSLSNLSKKFILRFWVTSAYQPQ